MKQIISRILLGLTVVLCISVSAGAAGINSAEQKVLDEISQPFSYNGKTYAVNGGNVSAARERLSEDSMDLTDSFANDCISQFHQSYEELVSGGYCAEVEDFGDNGAEAADNPEATPVAKHSKGERAKNKEFLAMMFGSPVESDSPEKEDSGGNDMGSDGAKEDNSTKSKQKKEPETQYSE